MIRATPQNLTDNTKRELVVDSCAHRTIATSYYD